MNSTIILNRSELSESQEKSLDEMLEAIDTLLAKVKQRSTILLDVVSETLDELTTRHPHLSRSAQGRSTEAVALAS